MATKLSKEFKAALLETIITAAINALGNVLMQVGESMIEAKKIEKGDNVDQRRIH